MKQLARKQENLPETAELRQVVSFVIGKEHFAVDILMVQEIIRMCPITPIPNSPEFIEGVFNLRGHIIPVIDLRKRLNLEAAAAEDQSRILVINIDERVTGFVVDSVSEVLKIPHSSIEPPPEIVMAGLQSKYIHGVARFEERLLILLDFSKILLIEEIIKLKEVPAN